MKKNEICPFDSYKLLIKVGTYRWCACGLSKTDPFCDDSHYGTGIEPLNFRINEEKVIYFCGCKKTKTPPYCDGTLIKNKKNQINE